MTTVPSPITPSPRTFAQRIGYLTTCVIPADLLSDVPDDTEDDSSLRADASRDGLSFVQVFQSLETDVYLARIAASPDCVTEGYTILFTERQLAFALPWEARLAWRRPASILALLRAHAAELQPLSKVTPIREPALPASGTMLTPLDTVEVRQQDIQEALAQVKAHEASSVSRRASQYILQQALLQAMIDTLMQQLYQTQERSCALILKARCGMLAQLQRWHRSTRRDRIVHAVPPRLSEGQQIWRLTVGLPVAA